MKIIQKYVYNFKDTNIRKPRTIKFNVRQALKSWQLKLVHASPSSVTRRLEDKLYLFFLYNSHKTFLR